MSRDSEAPQPLTAERLAGISAMIEKEFLLAEMLGESVDREYHDIRDLLATVQRLEAERRALTSGCVWFDDDREELGTPTGWRIDGKPRELFPTADDALAAYLTSTEHPKR